MNSCRNLFNTCTPTRKLVRYTAKLLLCVVGVLFNVNIAESCLVVHKIPFELRLKISAMTAFYF